MWYQKFLNGPRGTQKIGAHSATSVFTNGDISEQKTKLLSSTRCQSEHAESLAGTRKASSIRRKLMRRVCTRPWLRRCAFSGRTNGAKAPIAAPQASW